MTLLLFLVVVAGAWVLALSWALAQRLLKPERMSDGKALALLNRLSPADLGLSFSAMDFTVPDRGRPLRLAAWWIPAAAPSMQTVIILHGYGDAKIGGIAWAPMWHSLGWNVLALDLRGHGESEGEHSTAGFFERDDVSAVIDSLRAAKPQAAMEIALFGVSLGAACACGAAARRDDLVAVIAESMFADYLSAVRTHGKRLAMPLEFAHAWALRSAERISGATFDDVRPVDLVPNVRAPLMLIHSGGDAFVSETDRARLDAALAQRPADWVSERFVIEGAQHTLGLRSDPEAYRERVRQFLERARDAGQLVAEATRPAEGSAAG